MRVVILSRSARAEAGKGLGIDCTLIEQVLRASRLRLDSIDFIDPVLFYGSNNHKMADLQIHLEIPCRAAMGWASRNIMVVNPEWWVRDGWNWAFSPPNGAVGGFDAFVFKTMHARTLFPEVNEDRAHIIHWRTSFQPQPLVQRRKEFLYLIGSSINKLTAAREIVKEWRPDSPALLIVGNEKVCNELKGIGGANVEFRLSLSTAECTELQTQYMYHIVASAAEGFGHSAAEAISAGAIPIWTDIPTYSEYYGDILHDIGRISASGERGTFRMSSATEFKGLDAAVASVLNLDTNEHTNISRALKAAALIRLKEFRRLWRALVTKLPSTAIALPPSLPITDLPHVAIITLTRNRPHWWGNMVHNILKCTYPQDKLSWIIADDSDGMGRVDSQVSKFQSTHPNIHVKYLSMPHPLNIGDKRNKAVLAAPAAASVFIMMDDDDHYPAASVASRVAWLQGLGLGCVYCSTIPMYDCKRYISAINVPPLDLAPFERVSEATLGFTREFFTNRGFPAGVNIAEGEGFLVNRLESAAEIPPEGIIVSFIHGANLTSRRVPSSEPNGCHYGFTDDFFTYITNCGR